MKATANPDHPIAPARSASAVYRFSPDTARALADIFCREGYAPDVVAEALHSMRFVPQLRPLRWFDWRTPFLFGARLNRVSGITLGTHVFLASQPLLQNPALLAHEAMHVVQQRHSKLLPFLLRYGLQWARLRLSGLSGQAAYLALPDEQEARSIEAPAYLALRHITPWLVPE